MKSGGQPGNNNATKNKVWTLAIEKALKEKYGRKETLDNLVELAEELLVKCAAGDMVALKELGDRMEGKAHQSIEQTGEITVIHRKSDEVPFTGIREQAEKVTVPVMDPRGRAIH